VYYRNFFIVGLGIYALLVFAAAVVYTPTRADASFPFLFAATLIVAVAAAAAIVKGRQGNRLQQSTPSYRPIAAALCGAIGALIVTTLAGVPLSLGRGIAAFVFGITAYPFVREINDQTLPFPAYLTVWLIAATGSAFSSTGR
jgi:hypothetical protein